jgi:hypothetical protein
MVKAWLDDVRHHNPRNVPGLPVLYGGDKFVPHTTEGGGVKALLDRWDANPGLGRPHFLAGEWGVIQLLPLTVNAYTLENKTGGSETNKCGHVIQMEWDGNANDPKTDRFYEVVGKLIADCMNAGIDLDLDICPRFWDDSERGWLATYTSGVRLNAVEWTTVNTIVGHQHAPENAHWDPGYIDVHRLCEVVRRHLGSTHQHKDWLDMASLEEVRAIVRQEVESVAKRGVGRSVLATYDGTAVYELFPGAGVAKHLSPAGLAAAKAVGVEHVGNFPASDGIWSRFQPLEGGWYKANTGD